MNTLEETRGCAILDSGATVMCSSTAAADEIQLQRLRQQEPGEPSVQGSDRCFRFADGRTDEAQSMINQPITSGLLSGTSINMHLIDREGNETSPLFSIDDQRRHRMVIDYEMNKVMFKDRPEEWHTLPTTKKGLMMIPLTKEACDKHKIEPLQHLIQRLRRCGTRRRGRSARTLRARCSIPEKMARICVRLKPRLLSLEELRSLSYIPLHPTENGLSKRCRHFTNV